jgi:hypothetical protein
MLTLILGFSHVEALARALKARPDPAMQVLSLRDPDLQHHLEGLTETPDLVAFSPGGNTHNQLGLFEHDIPYSVAAAALGPGRRPLPLAFFRDIMREQLQPMEIRTEQLAKRFEGLPQVLLASPPPVSMTEETWSAAVQPRFPDLRRAPDDLRVAITQLQDEMLRESARRHGMRYLPVPPQCVTEAGMLAPDFCGADPTHANWRYGNQVLGQLRRLRRHLLETA